MFGVIMSSSLEILLTYSNTAGLACLDNPANWLLR
jgi:hypothetical protein